MEKFLLETNPKEFNNYEVFIVDLNNLFHTNQKSIKQIFDFLSALSFDIGVKMLNEVQEIKLETAEFALILFVLAQLKGKCYSNCYSYLKEKYSNSSSSIAAVLLVRLFLQNNDFENAEKIISSMALSIDHRINELIKIESYIIKVKLKVK